MLPEWGRFVTAVKLNKGLKDSNFDQLYSYLKQHETHANENKMMLEWSTEQRIVIMHGVLGQLVMKEYKHRGMPNRVKPRQVKGATTATGIMLFDKDVDEQPVQDLALNVDNVFQADDCDAYDSDVDDAPTAQTLFMANLSSADPVYDEVESMSHLSPHTPRNTVVNNLLNAELATYKEQVELYERRAMFELTEREQKIDEQLRCKGSSCVQTRCLEPDVSSFSNLRDDVRRPVVNNTEHHDHRARDFQISQLTEKVNGLQEQNELFRAENAKIKQHYKELNNREVHLVYLRHLKESVDTLREIVEEAKVERPLDRSLAFACRYTKHSQELLEYMFGTCPKVFHQQDKKHAHTPRKKQVTFEDQIATSSSNTHKHVEPMHTPEVTVPVAPST
ncbi:hypothetical protein Tco_0729473 [Tanacetum coccineum]|uniref:Integrase, catalytic region, zinc finger, CCHC-type, peptidase aspartic, catalytic n=1 Tax=Tanacetum coccineum TaxID=301880 RepID=A0ABQ4YPX1_9ASTR